MSRGAVDHPPRAAAWLVDLFTDEEQTSISGDLLEEFSDIASKSGTSFARRWYWRQCIKSIVHLIGVAFRSAPLRTVGSAIAGYALGWLLFVLIEKAVTALLYSHDVYAHIDAYAFWLIYDIFVERLVLSALVGCFVAVLAKGKEVVATMTLGLYGGAFSLVMLMRLTISGYWRESNTSNTLFTLLVTTFVCPVLIVSGGVMLRKIRSAAARRLSDA